MEFRVRPLGFMEFFLQNNNHPAVNKIFLTIYIQWIPWIEYIYLIYIYLLLLYSSSILDIEHSPYNIALGSTHTHRVI